MYGLFYKSILLDFWANNKDDIFLENTAKKLKLDLKDVCLYWYDISELPKLYEFTSDYDLILKEESVTFDNENNPVTDVKVINTIEAEPYFVYGEVKKDC
jgi:hypothetical protein